MEKDELEELKPVYYQEDMRQLARAAIAALESQAGLVEALREARELWSLRE